MTANGNSDDVIRMRQIIDQMNQQMLAIQETVNQQNQAFREQQERDRARLEETQLTLTQTLQELARVQQAALQSFQERVKPVEKNQLDASKLVNKPSPLKDRS